jgi:hypothetical protein
MNGARGPNMTHVVKPVSKYKKQAMSVFQLPLFKESINGFKRASSTGRANENATNGPRAFGTSRVGGVAFREVGCNGCATGAASEGM